MEIKEEKGILLETYKDHFSDEWLFEIVNTELAEEDRIPQIITGDQAEGRIINGHYQVELLGPNPGCKRLKNLELAEKRKQAAAEAKEAHKQAAKTLKAANGGDQ